MHEGAIGELTRLGKAAAVRLARRLGLPHDEPVILSTRGNLLVHLTPAPVVARVATLSARSRRLTSGPSSHACTALRGDALATSAG